MYKFIQTSLKNYEICFNSCLLYHGNKSPFLKPSFLQKRQGLCTKNVQLFLIEFFFILILRAYYINLFKLEALRPFQNFKSKSIHFKISF